MGVLERSFTQHLHRNEFRQEFQEDVRFIEDLGGQVSSAWKKIIRLSLPNDFLKRAANPALQTLTWGGQALQVGDRAMGKMPPVCWVGC